CRSRGAAAAGRHSGPGAAGASWPAGYAGEPRQANPAVRLYHARDRALVGRVRRRSLPQRHRPGGPARYSYLCCDRRGGDDAPGARRVWPLHRRGARSTAQHAVRASRLAARPTGRRGCRGTADRTDGIDRQQYRTAPAFRGAHRRHSGRSPPTPRVKGRWSLAISRTPPCGGGRTRPPPPLGKGEQEPLPHWGRAGWGLSRQAGRENDMVNRVILVGRLTRDPEIVTSPKGLTIAKLRLATNSYSKDDDGNRQEDVQYHSLVAFDRLASICQEFLTRGKLIYAEGRLRSHEWDGKDGLRRYTTEVVMDQMKMLSPKTESPV